MGDRPLTSRLARYVGGGRVEIVAEPVPDLPPGGLLVEMEACGLCSGELMAWYMDRKLPHVLGHEVAGRVVASEDARFPVGCRVFPHHHAPCLACDECVRGAFVHCARWRRTKLAPGGMAELFAVPAENLTDTLRVDDLRPVDAALIEPLACVAKALRVAEWPRSPTDEFPGSPTRAIYGEATGAMDSESNRKPLGSETRVAHGSGGKSMNPRPEPQTTGGRDPGDSSVGDRGHSAPGSPARFAHGRATETMDSRPEPQATGVENPRDSSVGDRGHVRKRQGANLPHWTAEGGVYHVVFRLADALPRAVTERWRAEREELDEIEARTGLRDPRERARVRALVEKEREAALHEGHGECLLRDEPARIVREALAHFDGERYLLHAWAVMPNHVHAVVEPSPDHPLDAILKSWKGYAARRINDALGRSGPLWQPESFDRLIRDEGEYAETVAYVVNNPRGGLGESGRGKGETWPRTPSDDRRGLELRSMSPPGLRPGPPTGEVASPWPHDLNHGLPGSETPETHRTEFEATVAVIGLGFMGLLHALLLPGCVATDLHPPRRAWASARGVDARAPEDLPENAFDAVFVMPGSQAAFDAALRAVRNAGTVVLFAPLGPGEDLRVPQSAYFRDLRIVHAYSCGPDDTALAAEWLRAGLVRAEDVVERFVTLDELPQAYVEMRDARILKAMVVASVSDR